MCFAPQRRALFQHLNFQKWSDPEVFCTFSLRNRLRATTACNFSSLISPDVSAPAALASLLFNPPEPQNHEKTQCFATFPPFRAPAFSFFWSFIFWLFSLLTAFSSLHIVGSLTSKLPSIIIYIYMYVSTRIYIYIHIYMYILYACSYFARYARSAYRRPRCLKVLKFLKVKCENGEVTGNPLRNCPGAEWNDRSGRSCLTPFHVLSFKGPPISCISKVRWLAMVFQLLQFPSPWFDSRTWLLVSRCLKRMHGNTPVTNHGTIWNYWRYIFLRKMLPGFSLLFYCLVVIWIFHVVCVLLWRNQLTTIVFGEAEAARFDGWIVAIHLQRVYG